MGDLSLMALLALLSGLANLWGLWLVPCFPVEISPIEGWSGVLDRPNGRKRRGGESQRSLRELQNALIYNTLR